MELEEVIKNYVNRIKRLKPTIKTEEATKTSLIMPFFQLLGYDVFNPNEFTPEYIADVGIKKGEKVDYAIILNGEPSMLIEAKSITESLDKHDSQLFRYFGTTKAKFAILTNGRVYKFFTDLEKQNVMDGTPFLEIDLEDLSDSDIIEISKFKKDNFDVNEIFSTAENLKYLGQMKRILKEEFSNPSDDFVKMILNKGIYDGVKTTNVIERYKPILKKSINIYFNELLNSKIKNVIEESMEETNEDEIKSNNEPKIVTTVEELQSFYTVKSILSEQCDLERITYKDNENYFAILLDNKVTRWLCRIYIKENVKYVIIPDENKNDKRYDFNNVNELYKYRKQLTIRLKSLQ